MSTIPTDLRIEHLQAQVKLLRSQLDLVVSSPDMKGMKEDFEREMQGMLDEQETETIWEQADFSVAGSCDCGSC